MCFASSDSTPAPVLAPVTPPNGPPDVSEVDANKDGSVTVKGTDGYQAAPAAPATTTQAPTTPPMFYGYSHGAGPGGGDGTGGM